MALEGILLECPMCGWVFGMCRSCYHGEKYCPSCRPLARAELVQECRQRYAATEKGKENQRERMKRYRLNKAKRKWRLKENVTDPTSPLPELPVPLEPVASDRPLFEADDAPEDPHDNRSDTPSVPATESLDSLSRPRLGPFIGLVALSRPPHGRDLGTRIDRQGRLRSNQRRVRCAHCRRIITVLLPPWEFPRMQSPPPRTRHRGGGPPGRGGGPQT